MYPRMNGNSNFSLGRVLLSALVIDLSFSATHVELVSRKVETVFDRELDDTNNGLVPIGTTP